MTLPALHGGVSPDGGQSQGFRAQSLRKRLGVLEAAGGDRRPWMDKLYVNGLLSTARHGLIAIMQDYCSVCVGGGGLLI